MAIGRGLVMVERMFEANWRDGLTPAQRAATDHGDAPLLIVAGAGTGKTRTLTARVAALVERGVRPERILLLTFTRRAAEEMLSRAAAMCSLAKSPGRLAGGTFHAVAHELVMAHAPNLGWDEGVSLIDPGDARDLMDLLRRDHQLADETEDSRDGGRVRTQRVPRGGTLLDIYSRAVNTGQPARTVIDEVFPWIQPDLTKVLELFRAYTQRKRATGPGRRLPGPVHGALGQGPGMGMRARDQRRGRRVPLRHGHGPPGRTGGGGTPLLRRHDPRPR